MCPRRDVERKAALPWSRLCVASQLDRCSWLTPVVADHHQLSIILDVLGTPSIDDFYAITSQRSREYIRALPFRKKKPFIQLFPGANPLVCRLADPEFLPI